METKTHNTATFLGVVHYLVYLILIITLVLSVPSPLKFNAKRDGYTISLADSGSLIEILEQQEATLEMITPGKKASNISLSNLPGDLSHLKAKQRIPLFIAIVLSHGIRSNNKILHDRKELIRYIWDLEKNHPISKTRKRWYAKLAEKYHASDLTPGQLLERVDIIPVSLTIAQAIIESGWGTSRFAKEGNALYGQHLSKNSTGKFITSLYGGVKVAAFDSLLEATISYMLNLNCSKAYSYLRKIRSDQRSLGIYPTGYDLARGLRHYSELGYTYVEDIRSIIKKYKLDMLEEAQLHNHYPQLTIEFRTQ